jgi:SAM-dependent methyltransferase
LSVRARIARGLPQPVTRAIRRLLRRYVRSVGNVDFGDLGGVHPISRSFGFDRGTPVDRFYIEGFLASHSGDIRGRVLEVGEAAYSCRFGSGITHQDVLHVNETGAGATIVGDMTEEGVLPEEAFDCMILTQTLDLIYDIRAAVSQLERALKRGGVALVTVPGVTSLGEWRESMCWALTENSARRLFCESFDEEAVTVTALGNVYAATCFLQGLAVEELDREMLAHRDEGYPVIVTIRARKAP